MKAREKVRESDWKFMKVRLGKWIARNSDAELKSNLYSMSKQASEREQLKIKGVQL